MWTCAIRRGLFGLATLPARIARSRYFRGHGVHSPFVYAIVRQAFMPHRLLGDDTALYAALRELGVSRRRAVQLQNLCTHCGYRRFAFDETADTSCDLRILTPRLDPEVTCELVRRAAEAGTTVALLAPYESRRRAELCAGLAERHAGTSVDNRGYLLLFTDERLPKQHYRI